MSRGALCCVILYVKHNYCSCQCIFLFNHLNTFVYNGVCVYMVDHLDSARLTRNTGYLSLQFSISSFADSCQSNVAWINPNVGIVRHCPRAAKKLLLRGEHFSRSNHSNGSFSMYINYCRSELGWGTSEGKTIL